MTKNISQITIVNQQGTRIFEYKHDFDIVEEIKTQIGTEIWLSKEGRIVAYIHPSVPVVIDYLRK